MPACPCSFSLAFRCHVRVKKSSVVCLDAIDKDYMSEFYRVKRCLYQVTVFSVDFSSPFDHLNSCVLFGYSSKHDVSTSWTSFFSRFSLEGVNNCFIVSRLEMCCSSCMEDTPG